MLLHLLSCLILFVLARVAWKRWKYDVHKIPSPRGWPIVGHGLHLMSGKGKNEITRVRGRFMKELGYPKIMKINVFGRTCISVTDMQTVKSLILKTNETKKPPFLTPMTLTLGNDTTAKLMFGTKDLTPYVKKVRRVYASAFLGSHLKLMIPELNGILDKMISIMETSRKDGPIDMQQLCIRLTLDVIGIVAFDTNFGGLDGSKRLYHLLDETSYITRDLMLNPVKSLKAKFFRNSADAKKDNAIVDDLTAEWVNLTRDILSRADPVNGETPMWYGLKMLADPSAAEPLEFKDLKAEIATVVATGMDTTGHQLCWTLALLSANPRVTQTLLEEFKKHGLYGEDAKKVSFEVLGELSYLTAVIKESMRVASIVASVVREAPRDMTILGYRIPKGTSLLCPDNRWLDSKEDWGDPEVFRPERWLDEDISQRYYLGFSYGPRDCAGQKLAMLEMRVALIRLLGAYEINLTVPFDEVMDDSRNGMTIRAEKGIWFHLKARN